jgi:hypothetical protein
MSAWMVELRRLRSGGFVARKAIPKDIRDAYAKLFGKAWEEKLNIPPGTPAHAAKAKHGEWLAEIETRIASLRAAQRNEGRPLTRRDAYALAARWYAWFLSKQATDLRTPGYWKARADELASRVPQPRNGGDSEIAGNLSSSPGTTSNSQVAVMEELAAMVTWLASEDCALTTGSVFDFSSEAVDRRTAVKAAHPGAETLAR